MRLAILDLGTNTFNLLIADTVEEKSFTIIHSSKQPVKLGKGGIQKRIITDDAMNRGFTAIENHLACTKEYNVEKVYAFATSAIRDATNSSAFIKAVKDRYKIYVHIIPGEREAELIYKGVRLSMPIGPEPVLILDIGGGSNEFIIASDKTVFWKQSFNLGMARMLAKFNPGDPITREEIHEIESFLAVELQQLPNAIQLYEPQILIGAAGSFETFTALLSHIYPEKYRISANPAHEIQPQDFLELYRRLLFSTIEERRKMPGMEPVRVEMIVLAGIFVNFTLTLGNIQKIFQSDYSLKEGVMAEILNI